MYQTFSSHYMINEGSMLLACSIEILKKESQFDLGMGRLHEQSVDGLKNVCALFYSVVLM